jgi:hypothetical protein
MTQVLIGDTRSIKNIARLKELNWGRMFAGYKPTPYEGEPWGFDNGAFKNWTDGMPFDEAKFLYRLWQAVHYSGSKPYLAVVPDIVAAGCSSLGFSLQWLRRIRGCGSAPLLLPVNGHCDEDIAALKNPQHYSVAHWKWYLAVQDGMTIHDVKPHLYLFDGVFLGGSDTFKAQAWRWCVFAHDNGKPFHYARAGTLPKLESALKMHADSLDSSYPLWENERFAKFQKMYAHWNTNPRPILDEKVMGLNVLP